MTVPDDLRALAHPRFGMARGWDDAMKTLNDAADMIETLVGELGDAIECNHQLTNRLAEYLCECGDMLVTRPTSTECGNCAAAKAGAPRLVFTDDGDSRHEPRS
jgi:hypothetical protein